MLSEAGLMLRESLKGTSQQPKREKGRVTCLILEGVSSQVSAEEGPGRGSTASVLTMFPVGTLEVTGHF